MYCPPLVANLLIIIFAGYESLVSKIDADDIDDVSVRVETNLK